MREFEKQMIEELDAELMAYLKSKSIEPEIAAQPATESATESATQPQTAPETPVVIDNVAEASGYVSTDLWDALQGHFAGDPDAKVMHLPGEPTETLAARRERVYAAYMDDEAAETACLNEPESDSFPSPPFIEYTHMHRLNEPETESVTDYSPAVITAEHEMVQDDARGFPESLHGLFDVELEEEKDVSNGTMRLSVEKQAREMHRKWNSDDQVYYDTADGASTFSFSPTVYLRVKLKSNEPLTVEQWNTGVLNVDISTPLGFEKLKVPFLSIFKGKSRSVSALFELKASRKFILAEQGFKKNRDGSIHISDRKALRTYYGDLIESHLKNINVSGLKVIDPNANFFTRIQKLFTRPAKQPKFGVKRQPVRVRTNVPKNTAPIKRLP